MRILTAIILLISLLPAVNPQSATERDQKAVLPDWSLLLPAIPGCERGETTVDDNKQGSGIQRVRYRSASDVMSVISAPIVVTGMEEDNCPSFELAVTYPFTPPPTPPLTKEQLREQKKIAKRMRKSEKK